MLFKWRHYLRILFIVSLALLTSCTNDDPIGPGNIGDDCVQGEGAVVSITRDASSFNIIESNIVGNIVLRQGAQYELRLEAQRNILDLISTRVVNQRLLLSLEECFNSARGITLYITLPELVEINLLGVGNINMENDFDVDELDVTLTGVGNIFLRGSANEINLVTTGVGENRAFDMPTAICTVTITGEGIAEVFVRDALDVDIEGVGTVFYKGNPAITIQSGGTGSVVNAN